MGKTRKASTYFWTLKIKVQGRNEAEAKKHVEARVKAFVLRGAHIEEGQIEKEAEGR